MSFSDFLEAKVLGHVFGGNAYAAPTTLYVALFTTAPNDAGTGGVEVSGGSYARAAVTPSTMAVTGTSPTQVANSSTITFTAATGAWGNIVSAGLYDASTGGNLLQSGSLGTAKTVTSGDVMRFDIGTYRVTLD